MATSDDEPLLDAEDIPHTRDHAINTSEGGCFRALYSRRCRIFGLLFLAITLHVVMRSSVNSALVAMVNFTEPRPDNATILDRCPGTTLLNDTHREDGEFNWTPAQQSQLLSVFFYGCVVFQVPGGYMAERFGGKLLLGCCSLLAGIFTVFVPVLARLSFWAVFGCRLAIGLISGPVFGCAFAMAAKWSPKYEMTFWVGGLMIQGYALGQMTAFSVSGVLIQSGLLGGWPSVFYVYGGCLILWSLVWFWLGADSPAADPTISVREREYIEANTDNRDTVEYQNPPLKEIVTSPAVLSACLVQITDQFQYYVLFSSLSIYMKRILAFDLADNGLMMALQVSASVPMAMVACPVSDWIRRKGYLTTKSVRVIMSLTGELSIASALILISLVFECERMAVMVLLIVGQFLSGLTAAGFNVTFLDFAPMYAGSLNSTGNFLGTLMGFVAPLIVGWITGNSSSRSEWSTVFLVTGCVSASGVIVYSIFTSGEEQAWAKPGYKGKGQGHIQGSINDDEHDDNYISPTSSPAMLPRSIHSINS